MKPKRHLDRQRYRFSEDLRALVGSAYWDYLNQQTKTKILAQLGDFYGAYKISE